MDARDTDSRRTGGLGWRLVRVGALVLVLAAASVALVLHRAYGDARRALYSLGETLVVFYGEDPPGAPPRTLVLNGVRLHLVTGTTDRAVGEVLDFYQRRCRARDGRFAEALPADPATDGPTTDRGAFDRDNSDPTLRESGDGKGFVACLDMGPDPVSLEDLADRARAFARTGDLGQLGRFRYIYAERGRAKTRFVAVWTDGETNLLGMLPAEGDAPGADPAHLPRPPDSQRRITSYEEGSPQQLYVYESTRDVAALERYYRTVLPIAGWRLLEGRGAANQAPLGPDRAIAETMGLPAGTHALVAARGTVEMAVLVLCPGNNGRAVASILVAR